MESTAIVLVFRAKLEEVLVELDRVYCYSALLGGQFFETQELFPFKLTLVTIERKYKRIQ